MSPDFLHQTNVLFKESIQYLKVPVMLGALHAKARLSNELRPPLEKIQRFSQQMNTLLEMKGKYGAGCIQAGYCSAQQAWKMKQKYRPPRYTACLNQLLKVD